MAIADIYQKATLVQIPSGYKAADAELYSVVPNDADGDFDFTRASSGTRVNKDGLIESTVANQARLNYDPSNPQDPHLLLEPTRTNLITQSTELTSGDLAKVNLTVADNTSIVDPQGGTDAKTLTASSTSQPRLEWRGTSVPASNTDYAMSFWVRYNTARYVAIAHFSQTGEYAIFDLVDGAVESDTGTQTAKIEAYPNGWYRISKSFEVPSSASLNYWKFTLCTQTNAFVGVNGEKADVFGLQFEIGNYPTSLIPTSGSAVTRIVDYASGAGNSDTFNDNEGTLFIDAAALGNDGTYRVINISDGTSSNRVLIQFSNNNNQIRADLISGGVPQTSFSTTSYTFTDFNKIALKYKGDDTALFVNGTQVGSTQTGKTMPTGLDRIDFQNGNLGSAFYFRGKLKQLMYFDTALSDAELITLTG